MASCFAACLALLVLSCKMGHQWHFAYFSFLYLKIKRCFKQVRGYSTASCFLRHRFFFSPTCKFYFADVMKEKKKLRLTGGGMWGTCFPRELWEDMVRVGSKASVQSHQLDEGIVFLLEHRSLSMPETPWARTMKKHTGTWNQDYRHIDEVGNIHKGDSWLLAEDTQSPYVGQLVVPEEGCSTYSKNFIGRNWGSFLFYLLFYVY